MNRRRNSIKKKSKRRGSRRASKRLKKLRVEGLVNETQGKLISVKKGGKTSPKVLPIAETPGWLIYNENITDGYRVGHDYKDLTKSVCQVHNETMNIWTHSAGAVIFIVLFLKTLVAFDPYNMNYNAFMQNSRNFNFQSLLATGGKEQTSGFRSLMNMLRSEKGPSLYKQFRAFKSREVQDYLMSDSFSSYSHIFESFKDKVQTYFWAQKTQIPEFSYEALDSFLKKSGFLESIQFSFPQIPMLSFQACAVICMTFSTLMHVFWVRSKSANKIFYNLDLMGIAILIFGSSISVVYYVFHCYGFYLWMYISLLTLFGGLTLASLNFKTFKDSANLWIRPIIYISQALVSIFPIAHWIYLSTVAPGETVDFYQNSVYFIVEVLAYLLGVYFYVSRFPEFYWRGKFTLWVNSHAIFHIFVVIGAYSHYIGTLKIIESGYSSLTTGCSVF